MRALTLLVLLSCHLGHAQDDVVTAAKKYLEELPKKEPNPAMAARIKSEVETSKEEVTLCKYALVTTAGETLHFSDPKKLLRGNCEQRAVDAFFSGPDYTSVMVKFNAGDEWRVLRTGSGKK